MELAGLFLWPLAKPYIWPPAFQNTLGEAFLFLLAVVVGVGVWPWALVRVLSRFPDSWFLDTWHDERLFVITLVFKIGCVVSMSCFFYAPLLLPCRRHLAFGRNLSGVFFSGFLLLNIIQWGYIFDYAVRGLDTSDTYKPAWLDYLG